MTEFPSVPGYRLISLLGEGGMGRVYLAEDITLGRRTAIKFVSEGMSVDPEARARFLREARTMATVEHAHVVRVYTFGEAEGSAYLVMEYVAGESLSQRLKRARKLDAIEALRVTRQVAEALDAAWEHHLVHRDIKPSNILIDTKGAVRVADFGLAKPLEAGTIDEGLTQAGSLLGTPHYLSPEQARGHPADVRSDIYSLGIVLYEMLAGERPFEGRTAFDIAARHMNEPLPSLARPCPDLPPDVVALVIWMTEKDPERRPQSYGALRERLQALGGASASTPIPTGSTHQIAIKRGVPVRARWAIVGSLVLLSSGAFYWASRHRTARPLSTDERLVVAVAPFSGPDEDSAKEGKVMAALIERAINDRLRRDDVRVIGADQTREPVRDHAAARILGESLGANAVIWGQAFALRGETEIQPYLTLVPRSATDKPSATVGSLGRDPLEALAESSGNSLVMGAQAPNQIELRKTGAAGVSDLVLTLLASHALAGGHADKALALLKQAPRTSENLQRRANALLVLNRTEEALGALTEAVALAPNEAQSQASLGDVLLTTNHFPEAVAAYSKAAASRAPYRSREAILHDGKLYRRETYREFFQGRLQSTDSLYMVALDPKTGRVVERHPLPGAVSGFSPSESGIEVHYLAGLSGSSFEAQIGFSHSAFVRPVFLPGSLLLRRRMAISGRELGLNFEPVAEHETDFRPRGKHEGVPRDFASLEETLRVAEAMDKTQPWFLFLRGQSAWAQGNKSEAEEAWRGLFTEAFQRIPPGTYTWMARDFERYGQAEWADRAYEEALKRRRARPALLHDMFLIDRLISFPVIQEAARAVNVGGDPRRGHLWLKRAREFGGLVEGDQTAAAVWEKSFREQRNSDEADAEADVWRRTTADPMNPIALGVRIDSCITLFLSLSFSAWLALGALLSAGRQRARARTGGNTRLLAVFEDISGSERRVLTLACGLAVAAYMPVVFLADRIDVISRFPVGLPDSLGSAGAVRWADEIADKPGALSVDQFVAAVAHHLAGDLEGARKFYNLMGDDPRAKSNLAAAAQGQLTPPALVTAADVREALSGEPTFPDRMRLRGLSENFVGNNFITSVLLVTVFLWVTFAIWQRNAPFVGAGSPEIRPSRLGLVMPGILDLVSGSAVRGQISLSLACGSFLAVAIAALSSQIAPASGLIAAQMMGGGLRGFPVPSHSLWTEFWAQPGAAVYWSCVSLAALGAIVLQILALRQARTRTPRGSQADLSLSSLDTRVRG